MVCTGAGTIYLIIPVCVSPTINSVSHLLHHLCCKYLRVSLQFECFIIPISITGSIQPFLLFRILAETDRTCISDRHFFCLTLFRGNDENTIGIQTVNGYSRSVFQNRYRFYFVRVQSVEVG